MAGFIDGEKTSGFLEDRYDAELVDAGVFNDGPIWL